MAALKDFRKMGSLFPSSHYACKSIVNNIPLGTHKVVEFGAGTGVVSLEILKRLSPVGHLTSYEINPLFVEELKKIKNPKWTVLLEDVLFAASRLTSLGTEAPNIVISGIPFSFLSAQDREKLFEFTYNGLSPNGKFIVYQNNTLVYPLFKKHFKSYSIRLEPRNIPPYFIMVGVK